MLLIYAIIGYRTAQGGNKVLCKKRRIGIIFFIVFVLMGCGVFLENSKPNPNKLYFYLTNAANLSDFKINVLDEEVKIIRSDNVDTVIVANNVTVWIDSELLRKAYVKEKLQSVYKKGGRIIIKGNDLSKSDLQNYFGNEPSVTPEIGKTSSGAKPNENEMSASVNRMTVGTEILGMLIYQQDGVNNITAITGSEGNTPVEIYKVFLYASNYDYIKLIKGQNQTN